MAHQYLSQANAAVAYLSTDELKELLNNDEKLEERIDDVVNRLLLKNYFARLPQLRMTHHKFFARKTLK